MCAGVCLCGLGMVICVFITVCTHMIMLFV